jgi:hypothetical protein
MKSLKNAVLVMTAAAALALSVSAQQSNSNQQMQGMQMKNGDMQHGEEMSTNQMMQTCHKNMQSMMDSNAQTTKDIEAAKLSNDPAKMQAVLDEAEKALSPMNEHMKTCMDMMNMTESKRGMCGTMSGESGQKAQEKKP